MLTWAGRSSGVPTILKEFPLTPRPFWKKNKAPSPPSYLGQSPEGLVPFAVNTCRSPLELELHHAPPTWGRSRCSALERLVCIFSDPVTRTQLPPGGFG